MYYGGGHVTFSFRNDADIAACDRAFDLRREIMKLLFIAAFVVWTIIGALMIIVPLSKFVVDLILLILAIIVCVVGVIILSLK